MTLIFNWSPKHCDVCAHVCVFCVCVCVCLQDENGLKWRSLISFRPMAHLGHAMCLHSHRGTHIHTNTHIHAQSSQVDGGLSLTENTDGQKVNRGSRREKLMDTDVEEGTASERERGEWKKRFRKRKLDKTFLLHVNYFFCHFSDFFSFKLAFVSRWTIKFYIYR